MIVGHDVAVGGNDEARTHGLHEFTRPVGALVGGVEWLFELFEEAAQRMVFGKIGEFELEVRAAAPLNLLHGRFDAHLHRNDGRRHGFDQIGKTAHGRTADLGANLLGLGRLGIDEAGAECTGRGNHRQRRGGDQLTGRCRKQFGHGKVLSHTHLGFRCCSVCSKSRLSAQLRLH